MLVYDFTVAPLRLKTRLGGGRASAEGHWRARGRLAVFTVNLNCRQPLALGGEGFSFCLINCSSFVAVLLV